ncbi:MAG TPA: uracil-DNA glycosylase family protein [Sphingomonas sp.]|jgi:uracil-DNA glycosylase family 4|uniref:uracil-DNA glycosylase family protein n=1 Tax=Sphingomonas sp. TaxID=28214 RepID=UPI002EDB6FFE
MIDDPSALPALLAEREPPHDCPLCPRLAAYRAELRVAHPDWYNAPVPMFGDPDAWLAIVGLSPGMKGGNRTGRVFTGEKAGVLLFQTLLAMVLAEGEYGGRADDGLMLDGVAVIDAVRCVPPNNQPTREEARTCRPFLSGPLAALPELRVVVALGEDAHRSAVKALGGKLPKARFAHLAEHRFPSGVRLIDSWHPADLDAGAPRLSPDMFEAVIARALVLRAASEREAAAVAP